MDVGFIALMMLFGRDLEWSNRAGSFERLERAAFIVDGEDGLACIVWPATQQHERATFNGKMPRGTVAIIHTHPRNSPWPSLQDEVEARRLDIAIYVLTPGMITKTTPSDPKPSLVYKGNWLDPAPSVHLCH